MDSLISAADLYLAFIFLLLYCCYVLELPFSTWEVVEGWGPLL